MSEANGKARRIGRYELLDEIGRGGMAIVYRANDTRLGREVALKLLHPHLARNPEARARFRREAQAVAKLHHRSIVEVYDYSDVEQGDEVFIVMELVNGITLRRFLDDFEDDALPAEAAALIAREIFFALSVAHEQGVVHRDVKPENILIGSDGTIRLSDFGIAHLIGLDQMTVTGQILGSPAYMSPEHIEMAELDARADIFSVGTMLYEMAVGSLPFQGSNPHQIIKRIAEGYCDHPLSVRPAIGHHVAAVIVKSMHQDPSQRYASAAEAVADLERALHAAGIEQVEEELAAFLADPAAWVLSSRPAIIERTIALGQTARRAGRLPEAMDHFNRVLALEPGNERAIDAVVGLSQRRRLRRSLERSAIGLAILVAIGAVAWMILGFGGGDPEKSGRDGENGARFFDPKHGAEPADRGQDRVGDAGVGTSFALRGGAADAGSTSSTKAPKRPMLAVLKQQLIPAKSSRTVVFNPSPMRVEIDIDGKERFAFKTTDRARALEVGTHVVTFFPMDERLSPLVKEIKVVEGEEPMAVGARLKWRDGKLLLRSNVDTVVVVAGRSSGRTNRAFEVPLESPEERVKVVVSAKGYRAETRQVTIAAGQELELRVDLVEETAGSL